MGHNLQQTIPLLMRFPGALDALLRDLPDAWVSANEGENTWDVREILGHLVHVERTDWMPRVQRILQFGESKPFDPLDRFAHLQESKGKALGELLDEFARQRQQSLNDLRALNLQPEDLERRGLHPALGPVTLSQLLASWAAHDLTHLHQIARVMARQYADEVGPWREYLGVLHCKA